MDSRDLELWQAEQLREALVPSIRYLHRLKDRMEQVGFHADDPLFQLVKKAHDGP